MIDLRSDTVTQPTDGMRRAIAEAAVGDEQKREDPSVTALQERVAALLGHEAGIFVPTATMANQIALKLHSRPGDVLIAEENAHVVIYEYGGAAAHAGLMTLGLPGDRGRLTPAQVRAAAEPSTKGADQRAAILALENTHNASGGRVLAARRARRGRRDRARGRSRRPSGRRADPQRVHRARRSRPRTSPLASTR